VTRISCALDMGSVSDIFGRDWEAFGMRGVLCTYAEQVLLAELYR
jgi:hypothetical protein